MSVIKLFLAVAGTGGDEDSVDIQEDGVITGLFLGISMTINTTPASGDNISAEVSFLSVNTIAGGHDSRGSLAQVGSHLLVGLANSHQAPSVPQVFHAGLDVKVTAGERIHLHGVANQADISGSATAYLYISDKADRISRRRR